MSVEDTNTVSSQMAGVAALGPGKSTLQATFSVLDHSDGSSRSVVEPLKNGPRHCGQFSALAPTLIHKPNRMNITVRIGR